MHYFQLLLLRLENEHEAIISVEISQYYGKIKRKQE